jgi:soluble lytic murein transglycosylase
MDLGFIPTNEDLMKPDINIKLGVKYMEEMLAKFQNNLIYTIASYNAGPDAVTDWVKKADMDPDLFVESIPYPETKNYVKKILTNFWIYKQLYS